MRKFKPGVFLFCLLLVVAGMLQFIHVSSPPSAPEKPECGEKPHYVWGMIPQSRLDYPPCKLVKSYGRYGVILEGFSGAVFVSHGNHLDLPDDTQSSNRFVDWENYHDLEQRYDATVKALLKPYCGKGEPDSARPVGVSQDVYPIRANCSDGRVHWTVTIDGKLLQNHEDASVVIP